MFKTAYLFINKKPPLSIYILLFMILYFFICREMSFLGCGM